MISKSIYRFGVLLIGVIFIFSSLGLVWASDPSPSPTAGYELDDGIPTVEQTLLPYYIWLCMRAWGIQISYQDSLEYQEEIGNQIWDWVIEYLAGLPSAYSINEWIAPWQSSYDYWGNYQFNNSALEDIEDFVQWLMQEFGLTHNGVVVIDPIYTLNGYTIYEFDTYYRVYYFDDSYSLQFYAVEFRDTENSNPSGYDPIGFINCLVGSNGTYESWLYPLFYSAASNSFYMSYLAVDYEGNRAASGSSGTSLPGGPSVGGIYWRRGYWGNDRKFGGANPVFNSVNDIPDFMSNAVVTNEGDTKILTSNIVLPYQDPNYTTGDSITIIVDVPSYSDIEWSGEVTVSNLPAIVSTGSIPAPGDELNPGMIDAWRPISSLIEMTADSMGLLIGIVYEFPEEVIIPIFAVLGGIIIFGIIHAMKEH